MEVYDYYYYSVHSQNRPDHHPAQHPQVADPEELAVVEAVHSRQAPAEYRPTGGRHKEERGGIGDDQGGADEDREGQEAAGGAERDAPAGEERPLPAGAG